MKRLPLSLLFIITTIPSCSLVPKYEQPQIITENSWSSENQVIPHTHPEVKEWWRVFKNDALSAFIVEALQHNPQTQAGLLRVEAARAQAKIAGAPLLPSLDAGASGSRLQSSASSSNTEGSGDRDTFTLTGGLSYEVDLWGKNRAAYGSAKANVEASKFELGALALIISSDTAQAYLSLIALSDRIEVFESTIKNQREVLSLLEIKSSLGGLTPFEVEQQKNLLYTSSATLTSLKRQQQGSINQLALLLGKAPEALGQPRGTLTEVGVPQLNVTLPSQVIQARPDIRAAEAALVASNFDIGAARAAYFPRVDLAAALSLLAPDIAGPSTTTSLLSGAIAAPLFRGGALEGGVEKALARTGELAEVYRQSVLVALKEVEDALVGVRRGKERMDQLQEAERAAERAYTIARHRFELGGIEFLQVLDTQRALLISRDARIQAHLEYLGANIALCKALGGGWEDWFTVVELPRDRKK